MTNERKLIRAVAEGLAKEARHATKIWGRQSLERSKVALQLCTIADELKDVACDECVDGHGALHIEFNIATNNARD